MLATELQRDLVLIGGGHAHVLVLRMLAMRPIQGLRITLISPASHTPYSGMLPGLVAGHYSFEETHIDLARLCQWAGVRLICAEVEGVDPTGQVLAVRGRPAVAYDVVSIDVGSQPELASVPGASRYSVPVKPVASLWQRWSTLRDKIRSSQAETETRIAMVGGGAGSVELIAAMAEQFSGMDSSVSSGLSFHLFCGGQDILQGYNNRARRAAKTALVSYGINLHLNSRIDCVREDLMQTTDGVEHRFDELFWCTGASAAPWIAASGLDVDSNGFLAVKNTLQSLNYQNVFGAGDCATQVENPRAKAGVFAVRQGPVLAQNLRNYLLQRPLKEHVPQQRFLSLLSLGAKRATADRGFLSATGAWVWRAKDAIDRQFMSRFDQLPSMQGNVVTDSLIPFSEHEAQPHCGGCGAKVGADILSAVLRELAEDYPEYCSVDDADDTALVPGSADTAIVQSIDTLREIVSDHWTMGRIAANHALSDLYASGAKPVSALASISLPFSDPRILQRDLKQLLAGALYEFSKVQCTLSGGHTMQGPELSTGFVVNGSAMSARGEFLSKRGLRNGDQLVVTKPLGTGALFASHMQLHGDGRNIQSAIDMMLHSNAAAAALACTYEVSACTDVTGFGLLGHLIEMLNPTQGATLRLSQLPVLPGACEAIQAGIFSTMHEANFGSAIHINNPRLGDKSGRYELLFDPQTSGGLLLGVAPEHVAELCADLVHAGYAQASVIGEVQAAVGGGRVQLVTD